MTTPILELPELQPSQSQPHLIINEALRRLEAATQISVLELGRNTPPTSADEGDRYIVGSTPTGAYVGHEDEVAFLMGGGWEFLTPLAGWIAFNQDDSSFYSYTGSAWAAFP